jgi:NADPH2 dehydrogenase
MNMAGSRLFEPMKIGNLDINHRIVMPAISRMRATEDHIPTDLMLEYYTQRAAMPGTLMITEANLVSAEHSGYTNAPGIWRPEHITGWKKITDAVHAKGCFIFAQLMGMGRMADPSEAAREGFTIMGASAIPWMEGAAVPKAMTKRDIIDTVTQFRQAAQNAIDAGFDGVELLGANGMLVEQFLQDVSNQRDDEYGGNVENRSRLPYEILQAMADQIDSQRVALRLSPWSKFLGQGMADPVPQYSDIIRKSNRLNLAWIHLIESRIKGSDDVVSSNKLVFAHRVWDGPMIVAGGYTGESARDLVDNEFPNRSIAVAFGRHFVANPDLVLRVREGVTLNAYDRNTFYTHDQRGYIDYPFSDKYLKWFPALTQTPKGILCSPH